MGDFVKKFEISRTYIFYVTPSELLLLNLQIIHMTVEPSIYKSKIQSMMIIDIIDLTKKYYITSRMPKPAQFIDFFLR